jgi:signal transduction histidine kinase
VVWEAATDTLPAKLTRPDDCFRDFIVVCINGLDSLQNVNPAHIPGTKALVWFKTILSYSCFSCCAALNNVSLEMDFWTKLDSSQSQLEMLQAFLKPFAGHRKSGIFGLFCALWLPLVLFTGESLLADQNSVSICLTNAQQVRELAPEIAEKNLPVCVRGAVTFYDAPLFNLFVQDSSGGIFVLVVPNIYTNISAGQEVEVEGVCDKGDYAPIVKALTIHILGDVRLPAPRRVSIDQLFTGLYDSQWVEVSGVVRSTTVLDGRHYLTLAVNGQRVMTYVENLSEADAAKLINTTIRLRGVCYSRYNMKRQLRVPWLAISGADDITIEQPSAPQPKEISIDNLAQFNSSGFSGNLVKVSGVVTLQKPDGTLFVQNGEYGLAVQLVQSASLEPGDRVIVSGYSALGQYVPILEDATAQLLSHGSPLSPVMTDLQTLLDRPENFDGTLVKLKADLINFVESADRQTLVLQSSNSFFTATFESAKRDDRFKSLKLGSKVALTGVFSAQSPEKWVPGVARSREVSDSNVPYSPPESVQIFLRSYDDVTVVQRPPWWTLSRLLWTIGIMALVLLAGLVWVVVLGRRVRRQTSIIEEKIRRAGVLEERDRIAREFHDTLEQELAAITIQLDAVEAQLNGVPSTVRQLLDLARNMSRRSLSEARRSVWDLRSHLLENSDLPAALKEMASSLRAAADGKIVVQSSGTTRKLPVVIEHNLLRAAQEALANALKHSGANKIIVALSYEPSRIQLHICDDGVGFDYHAVGQPGGGHFGLLDMRERAEKIGAEFSLASSPGKGTEITFLINEATANHVPERTSNGPQ